jgi:dolichyl-diphosphooligosaccharide--protein glycosyltransferase
MVTASALHWLLNAMHISINIRNVCVFLAPWMSGNTALATFFMGREVMLGQRATAADRAVADKQRRKADCVGLLAAAFVAIVPGYISRSVAGSYDNEGVAIFALVFTFALWCRAVNLGSLAWAAAATLSYFYMVRGGFPQRRCVVGSDVHPPLEGIPTCS